MRGAFVPQTQAHAAALCGAGSSSLVEQVGGAAALFPGGIGARSALTRLRARRKSVGARGFTLIELLVVIALVAILMGGMVMGMGAATNARLKSSATLVSSAIRSGFTRASATAKPMRIVFDLDKQRLWLEEGSSEMLVKDQDLTMTGGADPATEAERIAAEQTSRIIKGPVTPKSSFKAVKQAGFDSDDGVNGRALGTNISFREIQIAHQVEPVKEGRAYLYIWPGGVTELAYIQVAKGATPLDEDTMTLFVHPLTGKVKISNGAKSLRFPLPGEDSSEREDTLY